jgi:hypothetical protein
MGVRETINKNKPLGIAIVVVMIAVAAGLVYLFDRSGEIAPLTRAYFSDDDGKSYFVDDSNKVCPFDHDGKQAVQAYVFQCDGSKPFVGYLCRFNESGRKRMEDLRAMPKTPDTINAMRGVAAKSMEYKKPGDLAWAPANSPGASAALNPAPPAGETGDLTSVDP